MEAPRHEWVSYLMVADKKLDESLSIDTTAGPHFSGK